MLWYFHVMRWLQMRLLRLWVRWFRPLVEKGTGSWLSQEHWTATCILCQNRVGRGVQKAIHKWCTHCTGERGMSQKAEMGRGCVVSYYVFKAQWGKGGGSQNPTICVDIIYEWSHPHIVSGNMCMYFAWGRLGLRQPEMLLFCMSSLGEYKTMSSV